MGFEVSQLRELKYVEETTLGLVGHGQPGCKEHESGVKLTQPPKTFLFKVNYFKNQQTNCVFVPPSRQSLKLKGRQMKGGFPPPTP